MKLLKRSIFLFSLLAVLLMPGFSNAEITFQPAQLPTPSGILNNLPSPLNEFIKNARDISNTVQNPININLNQLNQLDITRWFQNIFQNSFLAGLYLMLVKILHFIGNLFISILNIIIDFIKQGLSLLR